MKRMKPKWGLVKVTSATLLTNESFCDYVKPAAMHIMWME